MTGCSTQITNQVKPKPQLFETISGDHWRQSIADGRARKSRVTAQIRTEIDRLAYEGINRKMTAQDQDVITLRELLLQIVKSYTNNHNWISVEAFMVDENNRILTFVIGSEQMDFKKLVGSQGRNARSLSQLMLEIGQALGLTILVRIKSPVGNVPEPLDSPPFDESSDYDGRQMANLVQVVVGLMTGAPCAVRHQNMPGMTVFICESPDAPNVYQQSFIRQVFMLSGNKIRRQFSVEFV